jgi:flavin reductase (DIM6/NTAB) family NADH-FMN oxidoreductase RutF
MPIDAARFRQVLGHFATGVAVITTSLDGVTYGMTVSSFTSLSLDPQLVLFCATHNTPTQTALLESKVFAVNVLARNQEHLSRQFATREDDKFRGVAYKLSTHRLPILDGALAVIECKLHSSLPGGDHTILIGEVLETHLGDGQPLIYYRSGYRELA